ncbi:PRD domain-containing protein [Helicovermis profundi]|uniref:PRD domain-containing protein n=1 Tax=Helicovermis profundi TaxID=3065157 RepID=A0AAU9E8N2_9FIRM|nr:PRD domain-containing protein [Clostridia bacterium S502]
MRIRHYNVIKVMNNNVILAKNLYNNKEQVLIGKGLGFGVKIGEELILDKDKIEKKFVAINHELDREYMKLVEQLDPKIMGLCEEFIQIAEKQIGTLNPHIHIALTDHIGFAIERIKSGQDIVNPFIYQIKVLYNKEYDVALIAKNMIQKQINISINESEVGFIALHLHSALQNKTINETVKYSRVLRDCVSIIENNLDFKIDESSLTFTRLISHLRGLIERVRKKQSIENRLLENIKKEFKDSYKIAIKLAKVIEETFNVIVTDDEVGYMSIHIDRVRRIKKNK